MSQKHGENDMATEPTLKNLPDWIECVLKDHHQEVKYENACSVQYLKVPGRKIFWSICKQMCLDKEGVPAQACRLVERYLTHIFKINSHLAHDPVAWNNWKRKVSSEVLLMMVVAIILTTKMSNTGLRRKYENFKTLLLNSGVTYTDARMREMEFEMFKVVDFQLPLWTSADIAQALAVSLKKSLQWSEHVTIVTDIAEFNRLAIFKELKNVALSPTKGSAKLATLHLAAAAVVATFQYLKILDADTVSKIAEMVQAPETYIKCVSDMILKHFADCPVAPI